MWELFYVYLRIQTKQSSKQMKTKICSFWYKKLKSGLTSVYLYSYAGKGKYDKRSLSLYLRPDTPENRLLNEETRRTMQKIMFNETERLKKIYKIWFIVVDCFVLKISFLFKFVLFDFAKCPRCEAWAFFLLKCWMRYLIYQNKYITLFTN